MTIIQAELEGRRNQAGAWVRDNKNCDAFYAQLDFLVGIFL